MMKSETEILQILKKTKAIITDSHIVLTSGRHTTTYVNKDAVYPHTSEISRICQLIAERFRDRDVDVVAAPSLGGIILSQWVAYHLSALQQREVLGIYTEKTPEKHQILTRGYDALVKGKRALVVEDVTTTGGSVRKVVDTIHAAGGTVEAVSVMVNRDPEHVTDAVVGAPFFPMATLAVPSYPADECPLCKSGVPINTTVGKGREFLGKQRERM